MFKQSRYLSALLDALLEGMLMFDSSLWIWHGAGEPDEYADFKLNFNADRGKQYLLHLCCDTDYALYNGDRLVAFGQYSDYPAYRVFDTVDISTEVTQGENEFLLTVWYQGADFSTYTPKAAGVIFTLTENGLPVLCSSPDIPSRVTPGYIPHRRLNITVQLGMTFSYNAETGAEEFSESRVVDGLPKPTTPRPVKKLTLSEPMPSALVKTGGFRFTDGETAGQRMQNALICDDAPDGIYAIYDLGAESVGFVEFELDTDTACDVTVGWGEHLIDGRCRTHIGNRNFSFIYRAKQGENSFLHPFRRMGCRYLQIFVEDPAAEIKKLTLCKTDYPVTVKPFSTGNALRDKIYDVCINTLLCCMHEHYEDCPWREQALYTLDSRNQMLCGYYAFGETGFAKANLELISRGVREDGLLTLCYPTDPAKSKPIPAFSLVFPIQMREYLEHSGDVGFIKQKYPMMQKLISGFSDRTVENGLVPTVKDGIWNFYEWEKGLSGYDTAEFEAPLNAFYALSLKAMAEMAEHLGKTADAQRYRREMTAVNKALKSVFFDEATKLFRTCHDRRFDEYSVLTNSLCLLCGAAETVDKTNILKVLAANGDGGLELNVIPNSLSMNTFRFDALLAEDREKYSEVILSELDRTYGKMLQNGATSFWETEKGAADFSNAGSLCHGWSALPVYYYHILKTV